MNLELFELLIKLDQVAIKEELRVGVILLRIKSMIFVVFNWRTVECSLSQSREIELILFMSLIHELRDSGAVKWTTWLTNPIGIFFFFFFGKIQENVGWLDLNHPFIQRFTKSGDPWGRWCSISKLLDKWSSSCMVVEHELGNGYIKLIKSWWKSFKAKDVD